MNTASDDRQEWERCEAGLLVEYANQAKLARRKQVVVRRSTSALVAICAIGLGVWATAWWTSPREYHFGGIACHEVQENMPAMMAGTLPDELSQRISAHLEECPVCRELMEKMQTGQARGRAMHDYWACDCPECQRTVARAVARARPRVEQDVAVLAMTAVPFHGDSRP